MDLSYLRVHDIEYTDLLGNKVHFISEIPEGVMQDLTRIVEQVPDPVEGRKAAECLVGIYLHAFAKGLIAQTDNPGLEITEAMAMFDEDQP